MKYVPLGQFSHDQRSVMRPAGISTPSIGTFLWEYPCPLYALLPKGQGIPNITVISNIINGTMSLIILLTPFHTNNKEFSLQWRISFRYIFN